jgi:hypothetical protein
MHKTQQGGYKLEKRPVHPNIIKLIKFQFKSDVLGKELTALPPSSLHGMGKGTFLYESTELSNTTVPLGWVSPD